MVTCTYNVTGWWEWDDNLSYPEPYEDIEGVGVLVGFLGTAWLTIAMVLVHYLVFFDPELDPFADITCRDHAEEAFKGNPIDKMLLGFVRRWSRKILGQLGCSQKNGPSPGLSRLQQSMTRCILNFVDAQLIAGLGILTSGFLSLNQDLSAYHWSLIVYLAWLSNITHLFGLTALRGFFHSRQRERGWRLVLMFLVMVLLLIALGPTAFFNWRDQIFPTISQPTSLAICYFSPGKILEVYHASDDSLSDSLAFKTVIVSMVLVLLNFLGKVLRTFHSVSTVLNRTWHLIVTSPWLALFLVLRLYLDIFASMPWDIYWLLISSLWATLRLHGLKLAASKERPTEIHTTWTFGQTLPVLMLLGPAIMAIGTFIGGPEHTDTLAEYQSPVCIDRHVGEESHGRQCPNRANSLAPMRSIAGGQSEQCLYSDAESTGFLSPSRESAPSTCITMQLETDPDSQDPVWLRRNYYETKWAP
ncbi:hypothetical protein CEP52_014291 [Fusarium oligoseptatum]|uniref:Uncharacterized protein n=1 Tax=Fusarium oligoseptatum TaxID=2604345 RepID=A0A428SND6_9HYPO|nr:hypothetical protein CEP52_014291 [Fusarium oligoseptatum]